MRRNHNIYLGNSGAIGAVKTDSQVSTAQHNRRKVFYSPARVAFIGLLRLNLWGLATILKKTAFEVDKATTDSQSAPNYWWDVQARWRNAWWNLGGTWSKFVSAVNAGSGKKPILVFLAPAKIKQKLRDKGIRGYAEESGIGSLEATLTAAAAVIAALTPLIIATIQNSRAKKGAASEPVEYIFQEDFQGGGVKESGNLDLSLTDSQGNITTAGYGLIGVGVLGLLLLGTKKKGNKKLF
jgi:hypothetical protein